MTILDQAFCSTRGKDTHKLVEIRFVILLVHHFSIDMIASDIYIYVSKPTTKPILSFKSHLGVVIKATNILENSDEK